MTLQLVPTMQEGMPARADRAYDVITKKYRWGGADVKPGQKAPYFAETAGRMLASVRTSMLDLVTECLAEGDALRDAGHKAEATKTYSRGVEVLRLFGQKVGEATLPYSISVGATAAQLYTELGAADRLDNASLRQQGVKMLENILRRYAPYLRYNKAMRQQFANPAFSIETQYAPYQYYRFIELFRAAGGKQKTLDAILKANGLTEKELKENYDAYNGGGRASTAGAVDEYAEAIVTYIPYVVRMQSMSPEEYAARPDDEHTVDTMLWELIEGYRNAGGDMKRIEAVPEYKQLDMARSERLSKEAKAHGASR